MQKTNDSGMMSAQEVMNILQISRATFYKMATEGEIPGAFKFGKQWRVASKTFWQEMEAR